MLREYDAAGVIVRSTMLVPSSVSGGTDVATSSFQYGDFALPATSGEVYVRWGNTVVAIPIDGTSNGSLALPGCGEPCVGYLAPTGGNRVVVVHGFHIGKPGGSPTDGADMVLQVLGSSSLTALEADNGGNFSTYRSAFVPIGDGAAIANGSLFRVNGVGSRVWSLGPDAIHIGSDPAYWLGVVQLQDGSLRAAGITLSSPTVAVGGFTADGVLLPSYGKNGLAVIPGTSVVTSMEPLRDGSVLVAHKSSAPSGNAYDIVKLDPQGRVDESFGGPRVSRGSAPGSVRVPFTLTGGVWPRQVSSLDERSLRMHEASNGDVLVSMRVRDLCLQSASGSIESSDLRTRVIRIPRSGADGMLPDRSGNLYTVLRSQQRFVGTPRCDLVQSFGGSAEINTGAGRDIVNVIGRGQAMRIATGPGNDIVDGPQHGRATILGGSGNDVLRAGWNAASRIVGGPGRDIIIGSRRSDTINTVDGRGGDRINCHDSRLKGRKNDDTVLIDRGDHTYDCTRVRIVPTRAARTSR